MLKPSISSLDRTGFLANHRSMSTTFIKACICLRPVWAGPRKPMRRNNRASPLRRRSQGFQTNSCPISGGATEVEYVVKHAL